MTQTLSSCSKNFKWAIFD